MQTETKLATTTTLNNGLVMPFIGFGAANPGEHKEFVELIKNVIRSGYRHIDTARLYGSEAAIGEAVDELIKKGEIKREELWITTKLWNDKGWGTLEDQLKDSLKKLQVDYVDLCLIHWSFGGVDENDKMRNYPLQVLWPDMESLAKKGLARSIGVSNFNVQSLCNLLSFCEIVPAVNQIEVNPYCQQQKLVKFCQRFKIHVTAYSPFFRGGFENTNGTVVVGARIDLFGDPVLKELAKKYGKSVGQLVLNWIVQRGCSTVPKTARVERLKENLDVFDFKLEEDDIKKIESLDRRERCVDPSMDYEKDRYSNIPIFD